MAITSNLLRQAAVVPVKNAQVCVISSRGGKRWVIPKGCLEPGKSSGEIALQEAWEEAGLVGVLAPEPIGTYVYDKAGCTCHVTVFAMRVTEVADDWPEREIRERCWVSFPQALARVEEPGLRELIRGVGMGKMVR
jgi:8-oxo-dGTP pyrophosphatase MutT (NUDIX family)